MKLIEMIYDNFLIMLITLCVVYMGVKCGPQFVVITLSRTVLNKKPKKSFIQEIDESGDSCLKK